MKDLKSRILDSFQSLPRPIPRIFVAVSGGLDSMSLFSLLAELRQELPPLELIHIHHGLRAHEADQDAQLVQKTAHVLGLACQVEYLNWAFGEKKSQDIYRKRRQTIWQKLLATHPGAIVALAHHQDDQAETLLLRLLRGTGVRGLQGMKEWRAPFWRPLLGIAKRELENYARTHNLEWREDQSNAELYYDRNWMRHRILAEWEERRPGAAARLADLAKDLQSFVPAKSPVYVALPEGKVFYARELQKLLPGELCQHLALDRHHVQRLQLLLQKGAGKLEAGGSDLWLSRGYLLQTKKSKQLPLPSWQDATFTSLLGTWKSQRVLDSAKNFSKAKDSLRAQRLPSFLQAQIPVLSEESRLLLPPQLAKKFIWQKEAVEYTPSPVANALVVLDDQRTST